MYFTFINNKGEHLYESVRAHKHVDASENLYLKKTFPAKEWTVSTCSMISAKPSSLVILTTPILLSGVINDVSEKNAELSIPENTSRVSTPN